MKSVQIDSMSQQILRCLYEAESGLKASQIIKKLELEGFDRKKVSTVIHSHIQRWKNAKQPQIEHNIETSIYTMTEFGRQRFEENRSEQLIEA